MDNVVWATDRLQRLVRLLEHSGKPYLHAYMASQVERLTRILAGRPYVLCTYYVPSELTSLYDVEFLYVDRTVGLATAAGLLPPSGRELGSICSYQQAFFDLLQSGILPPPVLMLGLDYPCADALRLMETVHQRWHIPLVRLTRKRLQQDLMQTVDLLSKQFGQCESMQRVARHYNEANAYKRSIDRLRIEFPGIADSADMLKLFTIENDFGSAVAVEILRALHEALAQRVQTWEPPREHPLVWLGLVPLRDINLFSRLPGATGFRVVFEEMWMIERPDCSQDDFFAGMAQRVKSTLFYHRAVRARRLVRRAKEVSAAAVVHFSQQCCSFLPPAAPGLRRQFERAGIPWVSASADVVRSSRFDLSRLQRELAVCREKSGGGGEVS